MRARLDERPVFEPALAGRAFRLELDDGRSRSLAADRWRAMADPEDHWMIRRCHGPTMDLGCGPGRLVQALHTRGVAALGVDISAAAIRQCRSRGIPAVQYDVFAPLPGEGDWAHVLLADGNIGIGGSPQALLRRATRLLRPTGTVVCETEQSGAGVWCGTARLRDTGGSPGPWFPWAVIGAEALPALARDSGLRVRSTYRHNQRCFTELERVDRRCR